MSTNQVQVRVLGRKLIKDHLELLAKMMQVIDRPYSVHDLNTCSIESLHIESYQTIISLGKWVTQLVKYGKLSTKYTYELPQLADISKNKEAVYEQLILIKQDIEQRELEASNKINITHSQLNQLATIKEVICKDTAGNPVNILINPSTTNQEGVMMTLPDVEAIRLIMDTFKNKEVTIVVSHDGSNSNNNTEHSNK